MSRRREEVSSSDEGWEDFDDEEFERDDWLGDYDEDFDDEGVDDDVFDDDVGYNSMAVQVKATTLNEAVQASAYERRGGFTWHQEQQRLAQLREEECKKRGVAPRKKKSDNPLLNMLKAMTMLAEDRQQQGNKKKSNGSLFKQFTKVSRCENNVKEKKYMAIEKEQRMARMDYLKDRDPFLIVRYNRTDEKGERAMLKYAAMHMAIRNGYNDIIRLMCGSDDDVCEDAEINDEENNFGGDYDVFGKKKSSSAKNLKGKQKMPPPPSTTFPRDRANDVSTFQKLDVYVPHEYHLGWDPLEAFEEVCYGSDIDTALTSKTKKKYPNLVDRIIETLHIDTEYDHSETHTSFNALHRACYYGRAQIAKHLVEKCDVDVNVPTAKMTNEISEMTDRPEVDLWYPITLAAVHLASHPNAYPAGDPRLGFVSSNEANPSDVNNIGDEDDEAIRPPRSEPSTITPGMGTPLLDYLVFEAKCETDNVIRIVDTEMEGVDTYTVLELLASCGPAAKCSALGAINTLIVRYGFNPRQRESITFAQGEIEDPAVAAFKQKYKHDNDDDDDDDDDNSDSKKPCIPNACLFYDVICCPDGEDPFAFRPVRRPINGREGVVKCSFAAAQTFQTFFNMGYSIDGPLIDPKAYEHESEARRDLYCKYPLSAANRSDIRFRYDSMYKEAPRTNYFLQNGADCRTLQRCSAAVTSLSGNIGICKAYLDSGADWSCVTVPLEFCRKDAQPKGCKINSQFRINHGIDPLLPAETSLFHFACGSGCTDLVKYLLEDECFDPAALDKHGKRPLDYCGAVESTKGFPMEEIRRMIAVRSVMV